MKRLVWGIALASLAVLATAGTAAVDPNTYYGMLSNANGDTTLEGNPDWDSGTTLEYWVRQDASTMWWEYIYRLTIPSTSVSHGIVGASEDIALDNLEGVKVWQGGEDGDWQDVADEDIDIDEYTSDDNGNPHLPGSFYGIKIDRGNDDASFWAVRFLSDRIPRWVDFYAKAGRNSEGSGFNATWNAGLLDPDPNNAFGDANLPGDFIADAGTAWGIDYTHTPDTGSNASFGDHVIGPDSREVPGLPAFALIGAPAVIGGVLRKLRKKKE
jgi:hypothetical protein